MSSVGVNWVSINDMSDAGDQLAGRGCSLSDAGINWKDLNVLSDSRGLTGWT